MKNIAGSIFWIFLALGLSSCSMPLSITPYSSVEEVKEQYGTVSAILTETAVITLKPTQFQTADPTSSSVPELTLTPSPFLTPVPTGELISSVAPKGGMETAKAASIRCDFAQPGRPIDITIPDETRLYPGESFSKTWRLVNAGSCSWGTDYAVVWFSGDDVGANPVQALSEVVYPGHSIDVTVDMIAPETPGTYQSNWKIRNGQGVLFGIGPNGDAPFWVRIIVVPVATPTVTPPQPTPTQTPAVFASGSLRLVLDDRFDLDTGGVNQGEKDDFIFARSQEKILQIVPNTEARIALFGMIVPDLEDCLLVDMSDGAVNLEDVPSGAYLCYRTHEGLPGWLTITGLNPEMSTLDLDFVTWGVP